jgi:hypothetical protein
MMRVKTENLSANVSISDLISTATCAIDVLLDTEANFHLFLAEQTMHEKCASICNLIKRSMHAPTIMTLVEIMLKISRSCPSERNRTCMALRHNNGADVDGLHRIIGEEKDPFLAFKDASPAAADVVTLVNCVHNSIRGKVVWEEVSQVQLGDISLAPLSNTILATELGLWFGCYNAPACVDMNDIQSISIHETKSSTCAIALLSAIDSFDDVSIATSTSTVHVVLKNPSEAQAFCVDLRIKFDLFKKLDDFARRSAVCKISIDVSQKSSNPSKRDRTYAKRVTGAYSSVPGLQDLIGMGYHTFGGFWNMPRPWDNPHCKMTKELRLRLPRLLFYHEDLGWLNHEAYYEAAMQMYIDEAYVEGGRGHNQNPLDEAKRIKNNFK